MAIRCTTTHATQVRLARGFWHTAGAHYRSYATAQSQTARRAPKQEGSIESVFASLKGGPGEQLPARFAQLKQQLFKGDFVARWKEVLGELELETQETAKKITKGVDVIPRVSFDVLKHEGFSDSLRREVAKTGSVVVTGAVPKEEALAWKQSVRDYAQLNKHLVKGFPANDIQVYELYNTKAQIAARTHPNIVETQRLLLSLWHCSTPALVDLNTPISYFDRLRIRNPGDSSFKLGPHTDGGSVERWEDPGYRQVFADILGLREGKSWKDYDPFEVSPRLDANQDLYHGPSQCSIFRPFQGWTSLSSTGPNEGTLLLYPLLKLSTSYAILRPFFRPRPQANPTSLNPDDWEVDLESSAFPGSVPSNAQEYTNESHPHLRLNEMMISLSKVEPGDQVYWHCDAIHAVESYHGGKTDASVFYIPAAPLTLHNADYLRDQKITFLKGLPSPDFPGGEGETRFEGRAGLDDVPSLEARRVLGLEPFVAEPGSDPQFIKQVNEILAA